MSGVRAHPRDRGVLEDVKILRARGLGMDAIARQLGMSRATLYRIVRELTQ